MAQRPSPAAAAAIFAAIGTAVYATNHDACRTSSRATRLDGSRERATPSGAACGHRRADAPQPRDDSAAATAPDAELVPINHAEAKRVMPLIYRARDPSQLLEIFEQEREGWRKRLATAIDENGGVMLTRKAARMVFGRLRGPRLLGTKVLSSGGLPSGGLLVS